MERFNSETIDQIFSEAFFEKELAPPPHVWKRVREQALIQPSKRGWLLAAAALSIFGVASFLFYSQMTEKNVIRSTGQKELPNSPKPEQMLADKRKIQNEKEENIAGGLTSTSIQMDLEDVSALPVGANVVAAGNDRVKTFGASVDVKNQGWNLMQDGAQMTLSMAPFWKKMPEKSSTGSYWAQAGFGAGNSGSLVSLKNMDAAPLEAFMDGSALPSIQTTSEIEGTSFSSGISAGKRFGTKWMAEVGLAFSSSRLQGTTNAIETADGYEFPVYFQPRFDGDLAFVSPFSLSSNLQFLSVPVRVGYRIIDRKVGWMVTSGMASNFLVKQSIESAAYDNFNLPKESSPFRTAYVSGTIGTEVYVGFAGNYQLGMNSQFGTALSNLTKPDAPFDLKPSFWQIGLNIRYIFK